MATTTAEQRRTEARRAYDAFLATCPTRQVLATLSDKWFPLVVTALADGPQRYGALRHRIAGVSQKMLTQTLRTLERDGLITRLVTPSSPPRVDYELTPLGQTLLPVLLAIKTWSETHIESVTAARAAYDERQVAPMPATVG